MSAVIAATCTCGSLSPEVVLCPNHHRYFRQGKELASVSKVIRSTWPIPPDFSKADPERVEHAKFRGILIDALFTQYLNGESLRIPRGTREDVIDEGKLGFAEVRRWWESEKRGKVRTQVILADDDIAGTCDVIEDERLIWDLKCVSRPESTYRLQLGAYIALFGNGFSGTRLIHCAFSEGGTVATVKPIIYDAVQCLVDWTTLRDMWRLVRRIA